MIMSKVLRIIRSKKRPIFGRNKAITKKKHATIAEKKGIGEEKINPKLIRSDSDTISKIMDKLFFK